MEKYDVIIIGAGISGLVAGNFLVDKGKRLLIVEKNKYPGGCACSFARDGYTFDAAVRWISQAGEGGIVRDILSGFGLQEKVRFTRLPHPPSIWTPGKRITPSYGKEGLVAAFAAAFPGEADSVKRFWDEVDGTREELYRLVQVQPRRKGAFEMLKFNVTFPLKFRRMAKYHNRTAQEVMAGFFKDPDLIRFLSALGVFPGISFVHYCWFNMVGLMGDAFYPEGGIQAVPDALAERFIEKGGEIRYRTLAEKIVFDGSVATGVRLNGGEEIGADAVVSASDAKNTLIHMVGEERLTDGLKHAARDWKTSESFFYVYLGVDMDLREAGFDGSPIWYFPKEIDRNAFPMLGGDALCIGMPSVMEPALAPPGKGVVIIGMIASCTFMEGCPVRQRGEGVKEAYNAVKERIGEYLIDLAEEAMPGLRDKVALKIFASPHTFERYTMNYLGASTGWSMAAEHQHKLPVRTPIPGLFMAGHWTMNPGGVPAAFVSGKLAAAEVVK